MVILTDLVNRMKFIENSKYDQEDLFKNVAFSKGINLNHSAVATGDSTMRPGVKL